MVSVLAGMLPEFRRQLAAFKTAQATVEPVGVNSARALTFTCHYEVATPRAGGPMDFETSNGYGYNVYPDETNGPVSLDVGDVIAVGGFRFEVMEYGPMGNLSGSRRAWCTKRG